MIGEIVASEAKEITNFSGENFKNIKPSEEMKTSEVNEYWKSEFQNASYDFKNHTEKMSHEEKSTPDKGLSEIKPDSDVFYTSLEDRVRYTNLDESEGGKRGTWEGERGNSPFIPSYPYMKDALKQYGIESIDFNKGEANFLPVAEATVKIDNMTSERYGKGNNFDQANTKLAEKFNDIQKDGKTDWTAEKVEEYRTANKLSWHERCDCKTMDLVPTKIHDYFKHSGGVAECKVRDGIGGRFDG